MGKISGLICVSIIYSNVLSDHAELQILNGKNFPQGERKCRASSSTMGRLALCPSETGLMVSLHLRPRGATDAREPFPWNARRSFPEQATTRPSPAMRGRDRTLRGARPATGNRQRRSFAGTEIGDQAQPRPCHHGEEAGRGLLPFPAMPPPAPSRRHASRHRGHRTPMAMARSACCAR